MSLEKILKSYSTEIQCLKDKMLKLVEEKLELEAIIRNTFAENKELRRIISNAISDLQNTP